MKAPSTHQKVSRNWYFEAICQGLTIGFSEVLLVVWYSKHVSSAVGLGLALTLPAAIGAIVQALATRKVKSKEHAEHLAIIGIGAQVLGLFLMGASILQSQNEWTGLFIGQIFYWVGGMTAQSPTHEILSNHIDLNSQNRFFSQRAFLITVVTLICMLLSAWFLENGLSRQTISGFILFAAIARLLSLYLLARRKTKQESPNEHKIISIVPKPSDEVLISIVKLSLCIFLFRFAVNISSPFYSAYMLNDLAFTITTYALFTSIPLLTKCLFLSNWARLMDQDKKFEGLFIAILLIGIVPFAWATTDLMPVLFLTQIASGLSWSGFDLISILLIQAMYPKSITRNLGLFLALGSLGGVAGGIMGGFMRDSWGASYHHLFLTSALLRLTTGFLFLWYLRKHNLFRFQTLQLKQGLATMLEFQNTISAAAKIVPLHQLRLSNRKFRTDSKVKKKAS